VVTFSLPPEPAELAVGAVGITPPAVDAQPVKALPIKKPVFAGKPEGVQAGSTKPRWLLKKEAAEKAHRAKGMLGDEQPKGDFIYPVHTPPNQLVALPHPERDHNKPIKVDKLWVKPTDVLEGRVVCGDNKVLRILLANSDSFTLALGPAVDPYLEVSSFVKFRVVRGVHPLYNAHFPLAVAVVPMPPPRHAEPVATVASAIMTSGHYDWMAIVKRLNNGHLQPASVGYINVAEGPTSLLTLAQSAQVGGMELKAGWDTKADLSILSTQVYCHNKAVFDDMGAHLVEFPIALYGFSPNSSVQILGVLENVPLRFKAADGRYYVHRENFVLTPCCFEMLLGWPFWLKSEPQIQWGKKLMQLNLPGIPPCTVPYTYKEWKVVPSV
jgi:hypothetical protein